MLPAVIVGTEGERSVRGVCCALPALCYEERKILVLTQVLLEADAVPRYCSQENLFLNPARDCAATRHWAFPHPHAEYYFTQFTTSPHFVLSEALRHLYPADPAAVDAERDRAASYRPLEPRE